MGDIVLRNINLINVGKKYGDMSLFEDQKQTNISELLINEPTKDIVNHSSRVHLINLSGELLPKKTDICCFWDRHPFTTRPIGCPIKLLHNQVEQQYYSYLSNEQYNINRKITRRADVSGARVYQQDQIKYNPIMQEHYIVDGIYCSVNCVLAFIHEEMKKGPYMNPMYKDSEKLLMRMYMDCGGGTIIIPADSWRLLKSYGGIMTIETFRERFNNIHYQDTGDTYFPMCVMSGSIFTEQIFI